MIKNKFESLEYRAWRDRFLRQHLKYYLYLAVPCLLSFTAYDYWVFGENTWNPWVESDFARLFFILLGVAIYQAKWSKIDSRWLILYASWSLTLLPNIWGILRSIPAPSQIALQLTFILQTAFLPFFWQVHLGSQIGAVFSNWISLRLQGESLNDTTLTLIFWFWFCCICTMAVYFYERLQRQEFELRRELNILLNSVSHDLRTPVIGTSMVLQSFLQKAQKNNGSVSVDSSILARLLEGSDRQLNMIDSLLESQNTTQNIELNCQSCNLKSLIQSIVIELEPIFQENGVVVCNILPEIPIINADTLKIWRVLNNLIINACKHNPYGIELTIDAALDNDYICIYIIDNGVGIAPKQQARLFELYSKSDRAHYLPGLGMGLYICQQIILAHGGEIGLDSYLGKGSTFWFTLPTNQNSFLSS